MRKRFAALGMAETSWALADQGVMSLGNFATNILLARNLPSTDYGVFSLTYGVILLLSTVHASFVIHPLSIQGASAEDHQLKTMVCRSLFLTMFVGTALSPFLAGVLWAVGRIDLLLWTLLVLFSWQAQQTVRRALMTHQRFKEAFWGDALSFLGQSALIWLLAKAGTLNLVQTFAVIAATSILGGKLQLKNLQLRLQRPFFLQSTAASFWLLGRWVLLINLLAMPVSQVLPWLLMFSHGAEEVAAYQAITNILAGVNPVIFSMGHLMLPVSVKAHTLEGTQSAWRQSRVYAVHGGLLLAPFFLALLFWPQCFLGLLYGHDSAYSGLTFPLRVLVAGAILDYLAQMTGGFLNNINEPRLSFFAQTASASAALLTGPPLVLWAGVLGAAGGNTVANAVKAAFSVALLSHKLKRSTPPSPHPSH